MIEFVDASSGARIKVVGVGGGGGNAVNTMIAAGLPGVDFLAANTDAQALRSNLAPVKMQLGEKETRGLGAGGKPEVGRIAAEADVDRLREYLEGADMIFITAGMGGGTGTGAAPIIAKVSKELGSLTVGVVTKPFAFEGKRRMRQAEEGMRELKANVDTLIAIPNQRLLAVAGRNSAILETFKKADEMLEVAGLGGRAPRRLSRRALSDVVEPRAHEILVLVKREMERALAERTLASGIVLTGGGAVLDQMVGLAERVFRTPVRLGTPLHLNGLVDAVASPMYSTSVGLVLHGLRQHGGSRARHTAGVLGQLGVMRERMMGWLREFF